VVTPYKHEGHDVVIARFSVGTCYVTAGNYVLTDNNIWSATAPIWRFAIYKSAEAAMIALEALYAPKLTDRDLALLTVEGW